MGKKLFDSAILSMRYFMDTLDMKLEKSNRCDLRRRHQTRFSDAGLELPKESARKLHGLELAVVGQNLLEEHHYEFDLSDEGLIPCPVDRGVYGQVSWRF